MQRICLTPGEKFNGIHDLLSATLTFFSSEMNPIENGRDDKYIICDGANNETDLLKYERSGKKYPPNRCLKLLVNIFFS